MVATENEHASQCQTRFGTTTKPFLHVGQQIQTRPGSSQTRSRLQHLTLCSGARGGPGQREPASQRYRHGVRARAAQLLRAVLGADVDQHPHPGDAGAGRPLHTARRRRPGPRGERSEAQSIADIAMTSETFC